MIRKAEIKDVGAMVQFGQEVCEGSGFDKWFKYNPWSFHAYVSEMVKSNDSAVFIASDKDRDLIGMLGVVLDQIYYSGKNKFANCMFTWMRKSERGKGLGGKLIAASVEWARENGATHHGLYVLPWGDGDKMAKMYSKHGYEPIQTVYAKRLS